MRASCLAARLLTGPGSLRRQLARTRYACDAAPLALRFPDAGRRHRPGGGHRGRQGRAGAGRLVRQPHHRGRRDVRRREPDRRRRLHVGLPGRRAVLRRGQRVLVLPLVRQLHQRGSRRRLAALRRRRGPAEVPAPDHPALLGGHRRHPLHGGRQPGARRSQRRHQQFRLGIELPVSVFREQRQVPVLRRRRQPRRGRLRQPHRRSCSTTTGATSWGRASARR